MAYVRMTNVSGLLSCWCAKLTFGAVCTLLSLGRMSGAIAQLYPIADDTLGDERSIVISPADGLVDRIVGGARRGDNLFHSFETFHVQQGRSVYFDDLGVENVISRVTGSEASQILGLLGASGSANLFLINPNGIVFGEGASLDLGGSFTATTADIVQFETQGAFGVSDLSAPALLTVDPSSFIFSQLRPAAIVSSALAMPSVNLGSPFGGGLSVADGEAITLLGGDVRLNQSGLRALGGRIEIGGLSQPGEVKRSAEGSLTFSEGAVRADISIANQSSISTLDTTVSGGRITLTARSLEIISSDITAGTAASSSFAAGQSGDITLTADSIQATDALIDNSVLGLAGNSGDILIRSRDRIVFDSSNIFNTVGTPSTQTAVGNSGNIEITTDTLTLSDNSDLVTSTFGRGDAGNIVIDVAGRVELNNNSDIFSDVGASSIERTAEGNGGNITIRADTLALMNNSDLTASTFGVGNAGSIAIDAGSRVELNNNSDIFSDVGALSTETRAVGSGGNIKISTDTLTLRDNSDIDASTFGKGDAGDITISALGLVALNNNSDIFSDVGDPFTEAVAVGNGGNVAITAGTLTLTNNSDLTASTFGKGDAGNIMIEAAGLVALDNNSDIFSDVGALSAETVAIGRGGNITITAERLTLRDNSTLDASTFGRGSAGNINLTADNIQLANQALITTDTNQIDGGDITIRGADLLLLREGSLISATAGTREAGGDGGNINIAVNVVVAVPDENSDIRANAFSGRGGSIQIDAQSLLGLADRPQSDPSASEVTASSVLGRQGTIRITTLTLEPDSGLSELPVAFTDASDQITQTCSNRDEGSNEFVITGRGGLPDSPLEPLVEGSPPEVWNVIDAAPQIPAAMLERDTTSLASLAPAIVEAQNWRRNSSGTVELVGAEHLFTQQHTAVC